MSSTTTAASIPDDFFPYPGHRYACEIIAGLQAFCGIVANIIIVYVIVKFNNLHRHPYIYVSNYCISNTLYLIFVPTLFDLFGVYENGSEELNCLLIDQLFIHNVGNFIFISILALDWYMNTYYSQSGSSRCRQLSKFIAIIGWTVIVVFSLISAICCYHGINLPLTVVLLLYSHFFVFVLVLVVNVLRIVKMKSSSVVVVKSSLGLYIANSYVLCWLPNWIFMYVWFSSHTSSLEVEIITGGIGHLSSVVILIVMYYFDSGFNMCLRNLCKCKSRQIELETYKSEVRENQIDSLIE